MVDEHYSKVKIIELVKECNQKELELGKYATLDGVDYESHEEAVDEKIKYQLNSTLEFLSEERVKETLGQPTEGGREDYFYSREMNHSKATGGAYEAYEFNYLDAIFLGILVSLFNHPYLSKIRKNTLTKASFEEELSWIESYKKELEKFVGVWIEREEESTRQIHWKFGAFKFNIENLLYKITLISQNKITKNSKSLDKKQEKLSEIHGKLKKFLKEYLSLTSDDQIELFFGKGIKSRIEFAQRKVTERIKSNEEKRINGLEIDFANEMKKVNDRKAITQKLENKIKLTFNRKDIIELVKLNPHYGHTDDPLFAYSDQVDDTLMRRFKPILSFLSSEDVKQILDTRSQGYYKYYVNPEKEKESREYEYNVVEAVLLAVLLAEWDESLFEKARKDKEIKDIDEEEVIWIEKFDRMLDLIESNWISQTHPKLINKNNEENIARINSKKIRKVSAGNMLAECWESMRPHIEIILHAFVYATNFRKKKESMLSDFKKASKIFTSLPEEHQIMFYDQKLKKQVQEIPKKLEQYNEALKGGEDFDYAFYERTRDFIKLEKESVTDEDIEEMQNLFEYNEELNPLDKN